MSDRPISSLGEDIPLSDLPQTASARDPMDPDPPEDISEEEAAALRGGNDQPPVPQSVDLVVDDVVTESAAPAVGDEEE